MQLNRVFRYEIPTAIEFGNGSIRSLADHVKALGGNKVLIVADPGVVSAGVVERLEEPLKEADIPYVIFSEIEADPDISSVEKGTDIAKAEGCNLVVGVGGGSSLDTAKAIGTMLTNPGHIRDYVGINKVLHQAAPVIAVPTTAGTGSELTIWSVLSDKKENVKLSVGSTYNCPTLALCDPELTISLPSHVTAATGMDALTHALESYVNKATQPISEGMSIQAMKMIAKSLRVAVVAGDNLQARHDMLLASLIAAMAFNSTRLGLAHALAIPLGAHFKIPHGTVNAILLPEVMQFNLIGNLEKFAEIASIFGEKVEHLSDREAAERSVVAIRQLKQDVGITQTLSDYGLKEEHLGFIAEEAMLSGNVPVNPRKPTLEDLKQICRAAMKKD
ncbi:MULTISPECIES: iron-containing alcohol dehydrogenase [Brevibacillus]|uniref:Iron-containing alcohol dehydrogenase n=1 Tax=Brevibacillus invocatus TaxID=173959 RepID=A0A3M8CCG7_9BACL|nr:MULTISPECIES: iron-containing alcohol dehydrogenase [Brevibacillus]MDH4619612.1 iron-containing alcohol dehydrogenase [Brevibacillus sp. AY1]RNB73183.1 iron-containing alcohol dehydrogenase [Brevibacillus invocatus]